MSKSTRLVAYCCGVVIGALRFFCFMLPIYVRCSREKRYDVGIVPYGDCRILIVEANNKPSHQCKLVQWFRNVGKFILLF